jgi:hypothetical protein
LGFPHTGILWDSLRGEVYSISQWHNKPFWISSGYGMLASLFGSGMIRDDIPIPYNPTKGTNNFFERWWAEIREGETAAAF